MKWEDGREGGGVEDRRGIHPAVGGGLGVGALALIGYLFFGIDPNTTQAVLGGLTGGGGGQQQAGVQGTPGDQAGKFVDVVAANLNDVWSQKVKDYHQPKVVLYEQGTNTGCGFGQTAMGPFYCPNDETVYIDLSFWQEMQQLGASGADAAHAYVIAHEFGHHIQTFTGASQKVQQAQHAARSEAEGNKYSVALELQADCYAGVWAANASAASGGKVAFEAGDIEQGLKTANAIGDDTLQKKMQGRVTPEGFTHGTSEQRMEWLNKGYKSGDPSACDTFGGL